jgi:hypothetical protein
MVASRWLTIVAGLGLATGVARAEPRAQELFDLGRRLLDDGQTELACEKLAASARIEARVATKLSLASCYERLGRTASAWREYQEVAALAAKAGDSEWQREMYALERVRVLEKKLVRLTIVVTDPPAGLVIRHNGQLVPPAQLRAAFPVDPGEQAITASAPGRQTWTNTIRVTKEPVTMTVPALKVAAPAPPSAPNT